MINPKIISILLIIVILISGFFVILNGTSLLDPPGDRDVYSFHFTVRRIFSLGGDPKYSFSTLQGSFVEQPGWFNFDWDSFGGFTVRGEINNYYEAVDYIPNMEKSWGFLPNWAPVTDQDVTLVFTSLDNGEFINLGVGVPVTVEIWNGDDLIIRGTGTIGSGWD